MKLVFDTLSDLLLTANYVLNLPSYLLTSLLSGTGSFPKQQLLVSSANGIKFNTDDVLHI